MIPQHIIDAILIRTVEEQLFAMYEQGELNGTIHACIGQEFSALAVCGQLESGDFVFSNHRCHGHFLALTGDVQGLVAELMGRRSGVCGGVGGSQHLFVKDRFYSNGIQGGIVPVASGRALAEKLRASGNIGVVYIGDGTLGQGVVYESLNILSKWEIPLLVVIENNQYAQSTPQSVNLAGDILHRFKAFGIRCFEGDTADWETLSGSALQSISHVRTSGMPAALLINTYRLCSHSKSDDCRDPDEIENYAVLDPLNIFAAEHPAAYGKVKDDAVSRVLSIIERLKTDDALTLDEYRGDVEPAASTSWSEFQPVASIERSVTLLNKAFRSLLEENDNVVLLGEDIHAPYGGAFKVTAGLGEAFPDRVITTPISEQAITGIANGLSLGGYCPVLEIMFGDFITLAFDQIVNHASKFHHMYNRGVECPVIIRTPMGGHRGYGPTHSQTLDKFLVGIDNVSVVAINQFSNPSELYTYAVEHEAHPMIVIENKADYARKPDHRQFEILKNYRFMKSEGAFPAYRLEPLSGAADVCLVTYGGCVEFVLKAADILFKEHEILASVVVLTRIHPINSAELHVDASSVYVVEEGSSAYGFGSEVLAILAESGQRFELMKRIGSLPLPIPASRELERQVLIGPNQIVQTIAEDHHG